MRTPAPVASAQAMLRAFMCRCFPRTRRLGSQRQAEELESLATTCRSALIRFGQESDRCFTALARGLSQINDHLTKLKEKTGQLDRILQDRDEDRAISSAALLYGNAVDLVQSSVKIAATEQRQMDSIIQALTESCRAREVSDRNHLMLHILSMNMRMEAVRMAPEFQTIFSNIAASVSGIAGKINISTGTAFERIEAVIKEANSSLHRSRSLEQNLQQCASASIGRIERELNELKAALAPCAVQSSKIARLVAETGPITMRAICSLQHQDIVRQQLEHVSSGFDDLCSHLRPSSEAPSMDSGYIHQATRIQQAHIRNSRAEIERAARDVEDNLRALLATSTPLLEHFTELEHTAASALQNSHVAGLFGKEIRRLLDVARESEEANNHSSGLVSRIEDIVRVFSSEIASHELDVKIVALNAQIASNRIASADALSRIAEEVSVIADRNAIVTRELTRSFHTSLENVRAVKSQSTEFLAIATREKRELEQSVVTVSQKLGRLCERIRDCSAEALRGFQAAHEENQSLLEGLHLADLIGECYAPAGELCEQLLALSGESASGETLSDSASLRLESHRARYTMAKENTAHSAALGGSGASLSATNAPGLPAGTPPRSTAGSTPGSSTQPDAVPGEPEPASLCATSPSKNAPGTKDPGFGDGIELF